MSLSSIRFSLPLALGVALSAQALFLAAESEAAPTSYTSTNTALTPAGRRAASGFTGDSRTGIVSIEDFEDAVFAGFPSDIEGIGQTIDQSAIASTTPLPTNVFQANEIVPRLSMVNPSPSSAVHFAAYDDGAGNNLFAGSTKAIQVGGLGGTHTDTMEITFGQGTGVTAVGFDVFALNSGFNTVNATIFLQAYSDDAQSNAIFATSQSVGTTSLGWVFIGLVTDVEIAVVTVTSQFSGAGTFEIVDNLVFNPEPSTFALAAIGMVGLAGLVRRRRRLRLATA